MTQDIRTIRIATQGPAGPAGLYPHANWESGSVPYARSSVLAHNGGVWLALRDTSVVPSSATPDDWGSWLDFSGMTGGFATLGEDGKIPAAELPAIAITDTFAAASQAAMLALAAQKGDLAIRSDINKSFVLAADDASVLANWKELLTPTVPVLSVAGLTGAIGASALKTALAVSAGDVSGLGALAALNVGSGLSSASGNLSANVTSVAGRTGAVTLAASDISGLAASATTDTTNASNIASGTLSNSRLSGVALTANNLSDLANAATARSNLGLGALATLGVGSGLTSGGGNLSANVTSVAGRTGAVSLAQADISGLTTASSPTFAGLTLTGALVAPAGTVSAPGVAVGASNYGLYQGTNQLGISVAGVVKADYNISQSNSWSFTGSLFGSGQIIAGSWLNTGSSAGLIWNSRSILLSPADGKLLLQNNNQDENTDTMLQFGLSTSAGAMIKRTKATTTLQVRLANDSADAGIQSGNFKATGSQIDLTGLPTSDPHVVGRLWANSGVLTVSAG